MGFRVQGEVEMHASRIQGARCGDDDDSWFDYDANLERRVYDIVGLQGVCKV